MCKHSTYHCFVIFNHFNSKNYLLMVWIFLGKEYSRKCWLRVFHVKGNSVQVIQLAVSNKWEHSWVGDVSDQMTKRFTLPQKIETLVQTQFWAAVSGGMLELAFPSWQKSPCLKNVMVKWTAFILFSWTWSVGRGVTRVVSSDICEAVGYWFCLCW